MRSALLLLVLLGVAPLGAQNAQVRNGSWVSFGLGFGFAHVSCRGCDSTRKSGAAAQVRFGWTLNQRLLLGAELNVFSRSRTGATTTLGNVSAALYYYPSRTNGFFVKGGVGRADVWSTSGPFTTGNGLGFVAGLGYDVRLGKRTSVTPVGSFYYGNIGELSGNGQSSSGLDWKQNVFDFAVAVTFH